MAQKCRFSHRRPSDGRLRLSLRAVSVIKTNVFLSHLYIKRTFDQDRLGTNMGKALKKRTVFPQVGAGWPSSSGGASRHTWLVAPFFRRLLFLLESSEMMFCLNEKATTMRMRFCLNEKVTMKIQFVLAMRREHFPFRACG